MRVKSSCLSSLFSFDRVYFSGMVPNKALGSHFSYSVGEGDTGALAPDK